MDNFLRHRCCGVTLYLADNLIDFRLTRLSKNITVISTIFVFLLFFNFTYAQQQQHIPWLSLADSPWPFMRGDMQATGRSKYIGPEY